METLNIIFFQTMAGSIFTIVALLIIAGIIGYFTSWAYAKSVYTPVIKKLEEEKTELESRVIVLKGDIGTLNGIISTQNEKVAKLEEELLEKEKEILKLTKPKK
jgi:peptidoglycan hydrolase CwlO-like protein